MHILQDILEDLRYETQDYSGRGMYGKRCLGVALNADQSQMYLAAQVMDELHENCSDEYDAFKQDILEAFKNMRWDSLGLGTIVYFPAIPYTKAENE